MNRMKTASGILAVGLIITTVQWLHSQDSTPAPQAIDTNTPAQVVPAPPAADAPAVPQLPTPQTNAVVSTPADAPAPDGEVGFAEIADETEEIPGATATLNSGANLITITLDDVEMVDVVKMFTRISGANIIASPTNLQGRVTVNLTDVEWKPALISILEMHQLGLIEKTPGSEVYSIVAKPVGAPEPLIVDTFFLRYASVSNVMPVVSGMVPAPGGVSAFPARNALVVRSTAANVGEVKKIITSIDTLREQVYIETKFMELNDEAIKDLGINWQVLQGFNLTAANLQRNLDESRAWKDTKNTADNRWDNRQLQDNVNERYDINNEQYQEETTTYVETPPESGNYVQQTVITPTRLVSDTIDKGHNISEDISSTFTKAANDVRTAVLSADNFRVVLSALKKLDGVTVVSNPKIVVANEEPAIIHIGQTERPFISSVTPGQQGIAPVITYNPGEPVDFGVKLTVTPTVNTESNITVKIEPELTRFLRNAVAPNGQTYPIIAKKNIRTTFCLESGKTAAIGGLTETRDQDVTTKIPLLGEIPLIGKYLFSHTHAEKSQQETIIFVTVGLARPQAIESETGMPEDTELARRHIIRRNAQRREFNEDIEKMHQASEDELEQKTKKAKSRLLNR
ncbi:MAG: hypothetical protein A2498_07740 [Lentisphaerae bacterium RIFOXYC12_FULL_60_16]|nr:MAG: hypothetical protein A2498_07740 [Lentisphaerae bacterium RIFOXYC12_FULL_60_16]OGV83519.1 MAG: hypothetical protein A2340_10420 [Lentisphaerae bacterium RIFOXYB12_FULL_60_10]